ncbi:MAG: hypothetical protein IKS32_02285 [Solobacterium sp.]|nr:hypothetical protein [Solobacterium sp.]
MKKLASIAAAIAMAASLAACVGSKSSFVSETIGEGSGLVLTVENAGEKDFIGTGIIVEENKTVRVSPSFTSGGVKLRIVGNTSDSIDEVPAMDESVTPTVEWVFDTNSTGDTDYDLEKGSYFVYLESVKKGTTGTMTVTQVDAPAPAEAAGTSQEDGQNPIMNFIGTYASGRCAILVEADGMENSRFTVTWGSSAWESSQWTMTGKLDTETLTVNYTDCVKKDLKFKEDGTVDEETTVYEDGTGSFVFDGGSKLTWKDEKEHAADDMTFEYAN